MGVEGLVFTWIVVPFWVCYGFLARTFIIRTTKHLLHGRV